MNLYDLFNEEKVRLDPKCWTGKKIGNPKTKVKGGVRVNNCVPAESVAEEYELAGVGVAYDLGRRAYQERKTIKDNPYSATKEARKYDEWEKGLERGKHDANDARLFRSSVGEQGVAEGQLELNTPDPVVVVQDLKGNILDKINLSVAAQKYKLGQPQNIKNQLAHQNYTKVGNYTIVSPMSGQPQDATTQGVAETELEEVDRRGFLKGLGAAAVAGAAGSAMAAPFKHSQTVDPMTDKVQGGNSTVVSDDGSAKLYIQWNSGVWFDLNQGRAGYSSASSGFPLQTMRIKLGNNPVQEIGGTVSKNFKSIQVGIDPTDTKQLASKILKHSGELRLEVLLADGNKKVFKFTIEPDATSKSVKEQGVAEAELDEKSVSQAQFRTMAGAAHNPEFARKVGISQDVAKEFNRADKHSNYKKLPDRATEGEQQKDADYRDPKEVDYDSNGHDDMVARVRKLAGLGPMKTVYDPAKRQYRNMPTAVQPKK